MKLTETRSVEQRDDIDDNLIHTVCCDPNTALCGVDVSGENWCPPDVETPDDCLVCEYLAMQPSSCCGGPP